MQPAALAPLVGGDPDVHGERRAHHAERRQRDVRRAAAAQAADRRLENLDQGQQQEHQDAERRHRLELAMAVGMVVVGRPAGQRARPPGRRCSTRCRWPSAGRRRGSRWRRWPGRARSWRPRPPRLSTSTRRSTAAICGEAAGAGGRPRSVGVAGARRQNTRAWGTGHQRTCTLPMMYFFGTMPQWRLSELLFRWSPITK